MKLRGRLLFGALIVMGGVGESMVACVGDSTITDATTPDVSNGNDVTVQDTSTGDGPTGCGARVADDNAGIFVASTGSDVSGCGARNNACKTLQYAVAAAKTATGKTTVYAASGTYAESVLLDAPISIEGGWKSSGATWTPICDGTTSTAVVVQALTNKTFSVAFTGSATLRDLKIISKGASDPGESLYGVFATGAATNLTLDQVVVDVGAGGVGVDGAPGTAGGPGSDGGCAPGSGGSGSPGAIGSGAPAGTLGATGYVPTSGGDASTGATGGNGTAGGAGQCQAGCGTCKNQNPSCVFGTATECATNGTSGCGGLPGSGGSCGTGGGSSIALFAWDAHVTVFGGNITSSNGGNGGSGGNGGDGGAGSSGAVGAAGFCFAQSFSCSGGFCVAPINGTNLNGGSSGGTGGAGGVGGQGGGGSGGVSFAIVQGGAGAVTLNGNPILTHGDGGTGGAAGGASGLAADRFP